MEKDSSLIIVLVLVAVLVLYPNVLDGVLGRRAAQGSSGGPLGTGVNANGFAPGDLGGSYDQNGTYHSGAENAATHPQCTSLAGSTAYGFCLLGAVYFIFRS